MLKVLIHNIMLIVAALFRLFCRAIPDPLEFPAIPLIAVLILICDISDGPFSIPNSFDTIEIRATIMPH